MRFWDRSEYWIKRGDTARAARSWHIAARCYRNALKHNPDLAPIWVQYGHALKESGRMLEADAAYRRSIAVSPYVADTHLQLGHLQKVQGDIEEAAKSYAAALRRDHGLVDAEKELRALGRDAEIQKIRNQEVRPLPLADQIASHYWWHSIDLGNGITTPGKNPPLGWPPSSRELSVA
jgi:tetratricopeptide (TPR) repeat protein